MMDQVHIGYTSWNNPPKQVMPEVVRISPEIFPHTFAEKDGYVSMEAEHYTRAANGKETQWIIIPDFGKTLSGVTTTPVTVYPENCYLEYDIDFTKEDGDQEYRKQLEEKAKTEGNDSLYEMLKQVDPKTTEKIHKNNEKRVIRALEFYK